MQKSHNAVAKTISEFGYAHIEEMRGIKEELKCHIEQSKPLMELDHKVLKDISTSWKGIISMKTIITGLASVILALGAIGAGVIYVV